MIPVRVPADLAVHTVGGVRTLPAEHPLYDTPCPVCDVDLADRPVTLVAVGIAAEDRKPTGYTTGAAVAVHAGCVALGGAE